MLDFTGMAKADKTYSKNARLVAFKTLGRISSGAFADIALESGLIGLSPNERPLATELVYGILRNQLKIDWIIDSFSSVNTKKMERSVLSALRLGAYQLLFLTKIPASAAINESVNLIKKEGAKKAGFVNAVLRRIDKERGAVKMPTAETDALSCISISYSMPKWLAKRWLLRYGKDEVAALCASLLLPPRKVIRANSLVTSRKELMDALNKEGFETSPAAYAPDAVIITKDAGLSTADSRYYIQDEASQLVASLLSPAPGERVLDSCAAPGGKTTHLAAIMQNKGRILALDSRPGRLLALKALSGRMGAKIIHTVAADSAMPLPLKQDALFDGILVDAPCSGLGVLQRTPDIKLRSTEAGIKELSTRQTALLENLCRYLKKGGRMVYSVCTFEPEETDGVIKAFLEKHPEFTIENAKSTLPDSCAPLIDANGFLRTLTHRHGCDGFFAVKLKKA